MFHLKNVGHGSGEEHSQWSFSIANNNLLKSYNTAFFDSSHRFSDISFSNQNDLEKVVQDHDIQHWLWHHPKAKSNTERMDILIEDINLSSSDYTVLQFLRRRP